VAGRASAVRPVKTEWDVLAWLSVWSEMQMIAYGPADTTDTPSSLAPVKSRMVYVSGAGLPRCAGKKAVKRMCSVVVVFISQHTWTLNSNDSSTLFVAL